MADSTICSVCVRASELGVNPDHSKPKSAWADILSVSEASVRRHFRHGPIPKLGRSDTETAAPLAITSFDATVTPILGVISPPPAPVDENLDTALKETWHGDEGEISIILDEKLSHDAILKKFGHNPGEVRIEGVIDEMHWQIANGQWRHKYRYKTSRSTGDNDLTIQDLPLLYSEVSKRTIHRTATPEPIDKRGLVVVWADVQVGKTGSRGGTPELIERIADKRRKLEEYIYEHPASRAYFLSVGDEVESFENTGSQAFTNDLSFPDQLDLELTFELDLITDLARTHDSVTVSGCSSNHCQWRKGKNVLGKPKDDYGLYIKRQLEKALRLNEDYRHVEFVYPDEWDETVAVDVVGTKVGLAHGHQVSRPDGIEAWWTKQVFGAQATANADILLTGHFHTFRAQQMGRSQVSGRNRWWLQAPTLDNGSDWFRALQGSDTDAGLMVFCVDENGLDLQSLTIL